MIQRTDYEQLLDNIVRLHHLELISFLKILNVTISYASTSNVAPSGSYFSIAQPSSSTITWFYGFKWFL